MLVADFEEGAAGGDPGSTTRSRARTVIEIGRWYHAAATYDGTTWRLYLNGGLDARCGRSASPPRPTAPSTPASATAMNPTGVADGRFNGVLDEVAHLERRAHASRRSRPR